ncbi:aminoglycoside phosphotransferase family protein [Streptomyces sp. MS1.AVA.3]|uniref:aminoglycoside phosphotransferase family protein n=1 Tax=Streptomyces decoyicus TaxID=249567 RepID=UPI0030C28C37
MAASELGKVPAGCRQRLISHYGDAVLDWLDAVPGLLSTAAGRWQLQLVDYYDAGHASAIALARTSECRDLLLKAWADPQRFRHEMTALRLWTGRPAVAVLSEADDLAVSALELVGGCAGGAAPSTRETWLVASAIQQIHGSGREAAPPCGLPRLKDFLEDVVLPRIRHRAGSLGQQGRRRLINSEMQLLAGLTERPGRRTVLHADLYRENVPFDETGQPVLIDPLPMVGDAAFDWAFWTVYYDLGRHTAERLATATRISGVATAEILPWCRLLSLDGLLYYLDTGDPRAPRMAKTLTLLSAKARRAR